VVVTDALLLFGVATVVVFAAVMQVEGIRRPGYDARYHTGSELELGPGGWIMRMNFFLVGAGLLAFAAGVRQALDTDGVAALLGVAGIALVLAGVFAPDPVRGFPPGTSDRSARAVTTAAKLHDLIGPVMTLALFAACLTVATRLTGPWAVYTLATAAVGLMTTGWLISAYRRDAANTGLVQRILLATYGLWVVVLGVSLASGAAT
jgi:hypothetical protein